MCARRGPKSDISTPTSVLTSDPLTDDDPGPLYIVPNLYNRLELFREMFMVLPSHSESYGEKEMSWR